MGMTFDVLWRSKQKLYSLRQPNYSFFLKHFCQRAIWLSSAVRTICLVQDLDDGRVGDDVGKDDPVRFWIWARCIVVVTVRTQASLLASQPDAPLSLCV